MAQLEEVAALVERGKKKKIKAAVQTALDEGASPNDILNTMIGVMDVVGEKFQRNEVFVPEMLVAALTMKEGVKVLKPLMREGAAQSYGKFIIGTVKGDMHDIGKNLVALMVESAGFEVVDLGVDVDPETFVEAAKANPDCKIVALSALLTTTMSSMRDTVQALTDAGLRDRIKVMVGGAPITPDFAAEIGADAYTPDAGSAAQKAKELAS